MMLGWHVDAFSVFPVGKGWDIQVNEFDFRDNGGVVYEENGVKVTHWQRSHAKDGASAYRLDWNGMCFVWTGDGRPSKLDIKYAKGCDLYVTEMQAELLEISSGVQGVPPGVPAGRFFYTDEVVLLGGPACLGLDDGYDHEEVRTGHIQISFTGNVSDIPFDRVEDCPVAPLPCE